MGGLVCDVRDLLRYARFHLGDGTTEDGTQVLSPGSLAQMRAPQARVWGKEARGLPWALTDLDGVQQISHGGGTKGQVTLLALVPARNFALAVLTNGDEGGFVTDRVRRWVLSEYLDLDHPVPAPIESSEADLVQYVGRYRSYFTDLELAMLAGRLVGQVTFKRGFPSEDVPPPPLPPPMSVGRCEEDRLLVLDGPFKDIPIDVIRAEDGSIGWLRRAGRLNVREV
jgi:CubicO group peptidase (beta-lactamase class C family)